MSPERAPDFPPLPGGWVADTAWPPGVPLRGDECRGGLTEVTAQRSRPIALQPPHQRDVVGCHAFPAPERFELVHEQLQLAVERVVGGFDARRARSLDDRAVQARVGDVDVAPG